MGRSLDAARRSEQDNRTGARLGMGSKPKQNIKPNPDTRSKLIKIIITYCSI
jgi:hypothetical protein